MLKRFLLVMWTCGCTYIAKPDSDPSDPVTWSLINKSPETLYLSLEDGVTPLGTSIQMVDGKGVAFSPRVGCRPDCSDGCGIATCTGTPAVRPLVPGEAFRVTWDGLRYDEGTLSCPGVEDVTCLVGSRGGRGRYTAKVCYARSFAAAREVPIEHHADGTIGPAVLSDPTCIENLGFGYPSYDVLYEVQLQ